MRHDYRDDDVEFDDSVDDDGPESRRWVAPFFVCILFAVIGSGAALAWHEVQSRLAAKAPPPIIMASKETLLNNLAEAQQRAAAVAQRSQELLQAQAVEIKHLSETIIQLSGKLTQLSDRVDALNPRNAQALTPHPAGKKAAQKPIAPKHSEPAPLPLAPEPKQ